MTMASVGEVFVLIMTKPLVPEENNWRKVQQKQTKYSTISCKVLIPSQGTIAAVILE